MSPELNDADPRTTVVPAAVLSVDPNPSASLARIAMPESPEQVVGQATRLGHRIEKRATLDEIERGL